MKEQMGTKSTETTDASEPATHADWRPYTVWKSIVRKAQVAKEPDVTNIDSHAHWDPYAVWKRHIRGE